MTTRPILFSGEMVRAILSGSKTQTRRVIKPQPETVGLIGYADGEFYLWWRDDKGEIAKVKCPYGRPGDCLWVRETWRPLLIDEGGALINYRADDCEWVMPIPPDYKIDCCDDRWRPSIHMPRWASRLTLLVTAVRVERLQDISREDIAAEGMELDPALLTTSALYLFADFWDSINGKRGYGFDTNPFVWVVEFGVCE